MQPRTRTTLGLVLAVAIVPASAHAAGGRIPIYAPTVITQPGSYYVTRNFSAAAGPAITIQTSGVAIDLAGHTISQMDPNSSAIEIVPAASNLPAITIVNGQINGGRDGISFLSPGTCVNGLNLEFRGLAMHYQAQVGINVQNGCETPPPTFGVSLKDCQVSWVFTGVNLSGASQVRLEDTNITGTGGPAAVIQNGGALIGENLLIGYTGSDGMQITSMESTRLHQVIVADPTLTGIVFQTSGEVTLSHVSVYEAGQAATRIVDSWVINIYGVWIFGSGTNGIEVLNSKNVVLKEVEVSGSGADGIRLDQVQVAHLMYVTAQENLGAGIRLMATNDTTVCNSNASRNQIGVFVGGLSEAVALNDNNFSSNQAEGVFVFDGRTGMLDKNIASRNGGFGINFGPNALDNVYSGNRTRGNNAGGINATPGNINGGGNF